MREEMAENLEDDFSKYIDATQDFMLKYCFQSIDHHNVSDFLEFIELSINKTEKLKNASKKCLSKLYFYYGILCNIREPVSRGFNGLVKSDALINCADEEKWKLDVIEPLINDNGKGWLKIFVKCGLFEILDKLWIDYSKNAQYISPNPKYIFKCFDFPMTELRAIVLGESPINYYLNRNNESLGYAYLTAMKEINYQKLPHTIKCISSALFRNYFDNWNDFENNKFIEELKSILKEAIATKGFSIPELSKKENILFLNLRLTYFHESNLNTNSRYLINRHREMWDKFFLKFFGELVGELDNHKRNILRSQSEKLKVYGIFYSPQKSIQGNHRIRDWIEKNERKIEFVDLKNCEKNSPHVGHYQSEELVNLSKFLHENPVFYQIISPQVIYAINSYFENNTGDVKIIDYILKHLNSPLLSSNVLDLNFMLLDQLFEKVTDLRILKNIQRLLMEKFYEIDENEITSFPTHIRIIIEFRLQLLTVEDYLIQPVGRNYYFSTINRFMEERTDLDIYYNNYVEKNLSINGIKLHSLTIEVTTKETNDAFSYSVHLWTKNQKLLEKSPDIKIKKNKFIVQNEITKFGLRETTYNNNQGTNKESLARILKYDIQLQYDVKHIFEEEKLIPDLLSDWSGTLDLLQVNYKEHIKVSFGNILQFDDIQEEPKIIYNTTADENLILMMIDADNKSIHWLVTDFYGSEISKGKQIICYSAPKLDKYNFHRIVILLYGHQQRFDQRVVPKKKKIDFESFKHMNPIFANYFRY